MVPFWARTPCASMQPSLDKSRDRESSKGKQNRTKMNVLQISLIQDFKVQHNSRIYSDSRGMRMSNTD